MNKNHTVKGISRFDPLATNDDGSCYRYGCTYSDMLNYDPFATDDDGSCIQVIEGCMDPSADIYDSTANTPGICLYTGCIDPEADNYWELANISDDCEYIGCMNE